MESKNPIRYCFRLFSCERFSLMASLKIDRPLSTSEKFTLRFHGLYCILCRRFQRQIQVLERHSKALRQFNDDEDDCAEHEHPTLSIEAKERIRSALTKFNDDAG